MVQFLAPTVSPGVVFCITVFAVPSAEDFLGLDDYGGNLMWECVSYTANLKHEHIFVKEWRGIGTYARYYWRCRCGAVTARREE